MLQHDNSILQLLKQSALLTGSYMLDMQVNVIKEDILTVVMATPPHLLTILFVQCHWDFCLLIILQFTIMPNHRAFHLICGSFIHLNRPSAWPECATRMLIGIWTTWYRQPSVKVVYGPNRHICYKMPLKSGQSFNFCSISSRKACSNTSNHLVC